MREECFTPARLPLQRHGVGGAGLDEGNGPVGMDFARVLLTLKTLRPAWRSVKTHGNSAKALKHPHDLAAKPEREWNILCTCQNRHFAIVLLTNITMAPCMGSQ